MRISIDGPSASGKSSIGRMLAKKLSCSFLSTGMIYRCLAYRLLNLGVKIPDEQEVSRVIGGIHINIEADGLEFRFIADGVDVTGRLNSEEVGAATSAVSAYKAVREKLYFLQREVAERDRVILEGRDIGTVIMPDADFKFYLDASSEERGRRRYAQLEMENNGQTLAGIISSIEARDYNDMKRGISPLKKADGACYIDTTGKTQGQVIDIMLEAIRSAGVRE